MFCAIFNFQTRSSNGNNKRDISIWKFCAICNTYCGYMLFDWWDVWYKEFFKRKVNT